MLKRQAAYNYTQHVMHQAFLLQAWRISCLWGAGISCVLRSPLRMCLETMMFGHVSTLAQTVKNVSVSSANPLIL